MAVLQRLKNITQEYNGKIALRGVNLSVRKGEVLSIIGPNGAGKTTLLRIMGLLDKPVGGEVLYKGVRVRKSNVPRLRSKITMVFQRAVLFNTTVFDNVAYGLKLRNYSNDEIERRVGHALGLVGMEKFAKRRAKTLSSGEQQRVVIARALALEPELLLLDEPTANLDPTNTTIVENIIRSLKNNATVVVTTHNLFQARRLPDRVVCLLDGVVIDVGGIEDIFRRPKDERTKKFISGELF
ncbi:MAG: ATP-binding cassette domain-containing protein [Candidatus Hadarchaeaceae archaeon]